MSFMRGSPNNSKYYGPTIRPEETRTREGHRRRLRPLTPTGAASIRSSFGNLVKMVTHGSAIRLLTGHGITGGDPSLRSGEERSRAGPERSRRISLSASTGPIAPLPRDSQSLMWRDQSDLVLLLSMLGDCCPQYNSGSQLVVPVELERKVGGLCSEYLKAMISVKLLRFRH